MNYSETKEQATEYLRMILPILTQNNIPADPKHYAVWYEYASGRNEQLIAAVDAFKKENRNISTKFSQQLYAKYVESDEKAANAKMGKGIQKMLNSLGEQVSHSSEFVNHFDGVLDNVSSQLSPETDAETFQQVVKNLADETHTMQEANKQLTEKLSESTQELDNLRKELEQTKKAANTDALTRVANRKAFDERILELIEDPEQSFSLIIADIDFFKKFNDTYGHQLGDKVLRFVAQILQKHIKGQDLIARYGGEEFVVILPETPLDGALSVAENLRKAIQAQRLRRTDNNEPIGSITMSLGVSLYREGDTAETVIERADAALYLSKENGRNCVTLESSVPEKA